MSRSIPSFFIVFLLGNIPNFVSYLLEFDEFCERIVNASSLYFLYLSKSQETKSPKIVSPPLFLSVQRNIRGISSLILHPAFSSPPFDEWNSKKRGEQEEHRRRKKGERGKLDTSPQAERAPCPDLLSRKVARHTPPPPPSIPPKAASPRASTNSGAGEPLSLLAALSLLRFQFITTRQIITDKRRETTAATKHRRPPRRRFSANNAA